MHTSPAGPAPVHSMPSGHSPSAQSSAQRFAPPNDAQTGVAVPLGASGHGSPFGSHPRVHQLAPALGNISGTVVHSNASRHSSSGQSS